MGWSERPTSTTSTRGTGKSDRMTTMSSKNTVIVRLSRQSWIMRMFLSAIFATLCSFESSAKSWLVHAVVSQGFSCVIDVNQIKNNKGTKQLPCTMPHARPFSVEYALPTGVIYNRLCRKSLSHEHESELLVIPWAFNLWIVCCDILSQMLLHSQYTILPIWIVNNLGYRTVYTAIVHQI